MKEHFGDKCERLNNCDKGLAAVRARNAHFRVYNCSCVDASSVRALMQPSSSSSATASSSFGDAVTNTPYGRTNSGSILRGLTGSQQDHNETANHQKIQLSAPNYQPYSYHGCGRLRHPMAREFAEIKNTMHHKMALNFTGNSDIDFLLATLAHHEASHEIGTVYYKYWKCRRSGYNCPSGTTGTFFFIY